MTAGSLRFIAEIAGDEKRNVPANFWLSLEKHLNRGVPLCAVPPSFTCASLLVSLVACQVPWYIGTSLMTAPMAEQRKFVVERVQTGVRLEKRILKVLKAFAEYHDLTLGDLLEGIVLHAFDGKTLFGTESLRRLRELKKLYGLELDSRASHRLIEAGEARSGKREKRTQ
jgi:hypothetical protein